MFTEQSVDIYVQDILVRMPDSAIIVPKYSERRCRNAEDWCGYDGTDGS